MDTTELLTQSVSLLRSIIAIPSPSFEEEQVCNSVSAFLKRKGIVHDRLHNNIVALSKHYSPTKPTLMLCAHLDTVSPTTEYEFDPYKPDYKKITAALFTEATDIKEVVAGVGANDDGASVVAMIAAFRHFYEQELPINLMLILSAEEERSGANGMRAVWTALESGTLATIPDYAIVGEPTEMKVAQGERGLLVIDGVASGVSGHAARGEGINAIYIAMKDIDKLKSWHFDRVSPLMGKVSMAVTQINAGTAHNVIPDKCSFVVDIRPTELYTNEEIVQMLQKECQSTLTPRNLHNHTSVSRTNSPLLKVAEELGIETYISPTTSDWMRINCDAIKMGPGSSARSHRKNEYVTIDELREGINKYIEFINTFASYIYDNTME